MEDLEKKTDEELLILHRKYSSFIGHGSDEIRFRLIDTELQRRWQKSNASQVSTLIKEISALKGITDKSAETAIKSATSDNRLARLAIWIAIVSLVAQVIFSLRQGTTCAFRTVSNAYPSFEYHTGCYLDFDLGLLGRYSIRTKDLR